MAALTLSHPSASNEWPIQMKSWLTAEPQGPEDKQLLKNAQSAVAHLTSRAEFLLGEETVTESYVSIPFAPVKKIRVNYYHVGALKPVPYPLDE
jgi:hypothetical protein